MKWRDSEHYVSDRTEGKRAKRQMIEANLRLVVPIATGYARRTPAASMSVQDLIQEGCVGLIRGADTFNYKLGVRFTAPTRAGGRAAHPRLQAPPLRRLAPLSSLNKQ